VYSPDATTGYPGAKVTDLFRMTGTTANQIMAATMLDSTTTFAGQTPYWLVTWGVSSGSYPTMTYRTGTALIQARIASANLAAYGSSAPVGVTGNASWAANTAGPASAASTFPANATPANSAPHLWLGVRNV
jgi:hypothetical protein